MPHSYEPQVNGRRASALRRCLTAANHADRSNRHCDGPRRDWRRFAPRSTRLRDGVTAVVRRVSVDPFPSALYTSGMDRRHRLPPYAVDTYDIRREAAQTEDADDHEGIPSRLAAPPSKRLTTSSSLTMSTGFSNSCTTTVRSTPSTTGSGSPTLMSSPAATTTMRHDACRCPGIPRTHLLLELPHLLGWYAT